MQDGSCVGMPVEMFVHEKECTDLTLKALSVCARCPFKAECKADAESNPTTVGVWGGRWFDLKEETAEEIK